MRVFFVIPLLVHKLQKWLGKSFVLLAGTLLAFQAFACLVLHMPPPSCSIVDVVDALPIHPSRWKLLVHVTHICLGLNSRSRIAPAFLFMATEDLSRRALPACYCGTSSGPARRAGRDE